MQKFEEINISETNNTKVKNTNFSQYIINNSKASINNNIMTLKSSKKNLNKEILNNNNEIIQNKDMNRIIVFNCLKTFDINDDINSQNSIKEKSEYLNANKILTLLDGLWEWVSIFSFLI